VQKPDVYAQLNLFDGLSLIEVVPNTPVLLGRLHHMVVNPSAVRGLQQRVVQQEVEFPSRSEHSGNFADRAINIVDVLEHQTCERSVKALIAEWQRECARLHITRPAASMCRNRDLCRCRVNTSHCAPRRCECTRNLAITRTDIKHLWHTGKFAYDKGDDLIFIFGVSPIGESIDPPLSMLFPQTPRQVSRHTKHTTVRIMKFSVWPNIKYAIDDVLDLARWLDDGRWYGMWFADHYMPNTGTTEVNDGDSHEVWGLLPAVAVVTEKLRLGPLVAPTSIHHPALLANRAATLDHVSHGRFVLGLGAGWQINEHNAYGIELEAPKARVDRFEEAIQIVRSLLTEKRTNFDGSVYTITDAPCEPKPVQAELPILVGTGGDRMLRITARHADEWNTWGRPDGAAERMAAMREACERVGRDPGTLRCSVQSIVVVTDDEEATRRVLDGPGGERAIAGRPAELVEMLSAYRETGFDEFIVPDWFMGPTAAARREMLERFMTEVVSALN